MIVQPDLSKYPQEDSDKLWLRLAEAANELAGVHQALAIAQAEERKQKVDTIRAAMGDGTSESLAKRLADEAALMSTMTVFELRGDVAALEVEITLIRDLLDLARA